VTICELSEAPIAKNAPMGRTDGPTPYTDGSVIPSQNAICNGTGERDSHDNAESLSWLLGRLNE